MGLSILCPLVLSLLVLSFMQTTTYAAKKSYIVYMGEPLDGPESSEIHLQEMKKSHFDVLRSSLGRRKALQEDDMIYSYTRSMNGFAAFLDEEQLQALREHSDVISVFENKERKMQTTHSWDFLGLEKNGVPTLNSLQKKANFGEDVIIGNIDSGVWHESRSFNDEGMGDVPSRWKGFCQGGVICNRKLIGARYFYKGFISDKNNNNSIPKDTARDFEGHGTHTLSTAGGSIVPGVNVFGVGNGTAKGGSPKARVAAYRVCWPKSDGEGGCYDADIVAGFDAAIRDGVDVISVSLGSDKNDKILADGTSIGSFHAIMKGIFVVASGGNRGPESGTVGNVAPWLFTVGASTMDRRFSTTVTLGNKAIFKGTSITSKSLPAGKFYPLFYGKDARSQFCDMLTLDPKIVAGKIILCLEPERLDQRNMGHEAMLAGAVGMILANVKELGNQITTYPHLLPTAQIGFTDGQAVIRYINSTKNPTASISQANTEFGFKPNPIMARFSSRGPNQIEPWILKPDVTAPGVDIIAANTEAIGPTVQPFDKRRTPYITMSGTSMSCPIVAGIVGLLKAIHPNWSPAAIKSAIMTTATIKANNKKGILDSNDLRATPFAFGAGHVRPNLAADPGLVYDITVKDYINFLCAHGYKRDLMKSYARGPYKCSKNFSFADFNYPTITVPYLNGTITITRRVKNVGAPGTYKVTVKAPAKVSVLVEPKILTFNKNGEEKSFKVIIKPIMAGMPKDYTFGELKWSDGKHYVRSLLVVKHA